MNRARSKLSDGLTVLKRTVPFMALKTIVGIEFIEFNHQAIARHFCNDRTSSNGLAEGISFWNCLGRKRNGGKLCAINENIVGGRRNLLDSLTHRSHRCTQDIQPINFFVVYTADTDGYCCVLNLIKQSISLFGCQLLRIRQPSDRRVGWKDNG